MKILRKVLAKKALGCEVFNQDRRVTLNLWNCGVWIMDELHELLITWWKIVTWRNTLLWDYHEFLEWVVWGRDNSPQSPDIPPVVCIPPALDLWPSDLGERHAVRSARRTLPETVFHAIGLVPPVDGETLTVSVFLLIIEMYSSSHHISALTPSSVGVSDVGS